MTVGGDDDELELAVIHQGRGGSLRAGWRGRTIELSIEMQAGGDFAVRFPVEVRRRVRDELRPRIRAWLDANGHAGWWLEN